MAPERNSIMGLLTDRITLQMGDSRKNIVEKYVFDVKKMNIEITVQTGYEALVNGNIKISSGERRTYSKSVLGKTITAFVYQKGRVIEAVSIPFFAGQHTISLDTDKTAKATFALVGNAEVEVDDLRALSHYYDNTVSLEDVRKTVEERFKAPLSDIVQAAAKQFINSASTDVSIYKDLLEISRAALSGSMLKSSLSDMGLSLRAKGISLHLNPIGDAPKVIAMINEQLNSRALENLAYDNPEAKRAREVEDQERANQHEIDLINANNTNTQNRNQTNTITSNGGPNIIVNEAPAPKKKYCPNCGAEAAPGAKFCPNCGEKLN